MKYRRSKEASIGPGGKIFDLISGGVRFVLLSFCYKLIFQLVILSFSNMIIFLFVILRNILLIIIEIRHKDLIDLNCYVIQKNEIFLGNVSFCNYNGCTPFWLNGGWYVYFGAGHHGFDPTADSRPDIFPKMVALGLQCEPAKNYLNHPIDSVTTLLVIGYQKEESSSKPPTCRI